MNRLNVPKELLHLIEKREETDRRVERRRTTADRRKLDLGPAEAKKSPSEPNAVGVDERRTAKERRAKADRRQASRRKSAKRRA